MTAAASLSAKATSSSSSSSSSPSAAGAGRALYRPDPWLCAATTALVGLGLVLVYSASAVRAEQRFGDAEHFLRSQAARVAIGLLALLVAARVDVKALLRRSGWVLLGAMVVCGLVLVPGIGRAAGGARRWLDLGPVAFQPSELAKLAVVMVLAAYYGRAGDSARGDSARGDSARGDPARGDSARGDSARGDSARGGAARINLLMPALLVQPLVAMVLAEPDFGTAAIMEAIVGAMLIAAGLRWRVMALLGVACAPVIYHLVVTRQYRLDRIVSFLDPWRYSTKESYQLTQAWISIGSGGLQGVGLGESKRKLFFLPEAHTDFIFAILGEELGFLGVLFLLTAFAVLLVRGVRIAAHASSLVESYLAVGLTALIGIPAVLNMCVATGLIPTKGLALPFVSYGGSNVVVYLIAIGLLLSIDRRAHCSGGTPVIASSFGGGA